MDWLEAISNWFNTNYTLVIVSLGTGLLCVASGIVGTFTYLRKRALIGDVISHAVLPGVAIAFMLTGVKNPLYFILGAVGTGLLSVWAVDYIQQHSKLKPDTILALTLSVFFGVGIVLLTHIQHSGVAAQSGLDSFLFGKAASMSRFDVQVFSVIAVVNIALVWVYLRGLTVLSFDEMYAKSIGLKTRTLKHLLAVLTVVTVAIGVQAVGVVLMAALLITPAAGARFLTNNIRRMLFFAASIGAISGVSGAVISSVGSGMPTGPWVVLALSFFAILAILFGKQKGLIARVRQRNENNVKINNENVLKDLYHHTEDGQVPVSIADLASKEKYLPERFRKVLRRLERSQLVDLVKGRIVLNDKGKLAAREVVRKHRLWELYLSKYFHLAEDHLHDDAEGIEHVITPEIEKHLTELLEYPEKDPHQSDIPY